MQTFYVRFQLDTDFIGSSEVLYRQYNFPDDWTPEQIDNYLWEEYHDLQMEHYESYTDYYNYVRDMGYVEYDTEDEYEDEYWDEYETHVMEQGSYDMQTIPFEPDEMEDANYPLEAFTIRG